MDKYLLNQLVNSDSVFMDIVLTIGHLLFQLWSDGGSTFYVSLVAAVVLAALTALIIRFIVINVNRAYKLTLWFYIGCFLAACTTFVTIVLLFSLQYANPVVRVAIKGWEASIHLDHKWSDNTFRDAYEAVYALKDSSGKRLENFSNYPHPDRGGSKIPMNSNKSKFAAISVYLDSSVDHFDKNMPLLSWILWADSGMAKEDIYQDMERVFRTTPTYQMIDAITIAGKEIANVLSGQTQRIIWLGRGLAISLFLFIQLVIIGLIVRTALRDIKETF